MARQLGARRVVLAVPVAPADTLAHLPEAETVVCVSAPRYFRAVGAHYEDFSPTTDDEVVALLEQADRRFRLPDAVGARRAGPRTGRTGLATRTSSSRLAGWPSRDTCACRGAPPASSCSRTAAAAAGTAPATGSSPDVLHAAGLGTLLLDLLTAEEEHDRGKVFDIALLAGRLVAATDWLGGRRDTAACRVGLLRREHRRRRRACGPPPSPTPGSAAVVSRGGRPDLAGPRLADVRAPTLLVVGGADDVVLELNRQARSTLMRCTSELAVVPGATHLFEEPGTLAQAALLARDWFVRHLAEGRAGAATGRRSG